jgi:hypothetical protein
MATDDDGHRVRPDCPTHGSTCTVTPDALCDLAVTCGLAEWGCGNDCPDILLKVSAAHFDWKAELSTLSGKVLIEFFNCPRQHLVGLAWSTTVRQASVGVAVGAFNGQTRDGMAIASNLDATDGRWHCHECIGH